MDAGLNQWCGGGENGRRVWATQDKVAREAWKEWLDRSMHPGREKLFSLSVFLFCSFLIFFALAMLHFK